MAGNTRGRLKERFEGVHRNYDWVIVHCQECIALIGDKNPKLSEAIKSLGEGTQTLDELAQKIYAAL